MILGSLNTILCNVMLCNVSRVNLGRHSLYADIQCIVPVILTAGMPASALEDTIGTW